ncbi:MauE/DoxX family redox-associated membrane protein [Sinomicrobium weinanense]|uniref:Methylamine utilisation protein MauE domain-containing protein n=1 Tax=Sinomicrobium weinanense TaxID=2842200 RepID=A0A926JQ92_9FLAO|nr:MauE/DoxX family redox-associated membrane protein [Sinomicrobium weinanense]MBC9795376.1 hypothetical protein [Sinomicrobium weinanense]MBU3122909.1 hypothetical protein [Sinomicrobium weinanense]
METTYPTPTSFWHKNKDIFIEIIAFFFILLFVYAAFNKLLDGHKFYDNIRNSPIMGGRTVASLASWFVPMAEIIIAFFISWRRTRIKGFYAALGLLLLFTTYVVGILFFSPYLPCSCGGVISQLTWNQHLIFNIVCILLAVWGIVLSYRPRKPNTIPEDTAPYEYQ